MGTQQSGVLQLKIADIIKDNQLLKTARNDAQVLLREDPRLEAQKNTLLRQTLAKDESLSKHMELHQLKKVVKLRFLSLPSI